MPRRLTIAALALSLAAPLFADGSDWAPPAVDDNFQRPPEQSFYLTSGKSVWEGDLVARSDFQLPDMLPDATLFCMAAAGGADWAVESKDPAVEEKYLKLVDLTLINDGLVAHDPNGAYVGACGSVRRPGPGADYKRMEANFFKYCTHTIVVKEGHQYACAGKKWNTTPYVIVDSLRALMQSDHPETAKHALLAARDIKGGDKFFGPTVTAIVRDAGKPEDVRAAAATTLAVIAPSQASGDTIAPLWADESLKESTRLAALDAFAFDVQYIYDTQDHQYDLTSEPLKSYLPQLVALNKAHRDDQDKPDAIGQEAYCAGRRYPKPMLDAILNPK